MFFENCSPAQYWHASIFQGPMILFSPLSPPLRVIPFILRVTIRGEVSFGWGFQWLTSDNTIEYTPFHRIHASASSGRLGASWRQKLISAFPVASVYGALESCFQPTLSPKLQIYMSLCLWTSPLGELIMLKLEFIIFQISKHFLVLYFFPEWTGNIIYSCINWILKLILSNYLSLILYS